MEKRIQVLGRWVACLLVIRLIAGVVRAFVPFTFPEVWRQVDTLGVAVRYFNRWAYETSTGAGRFLPAILNSGDTPGIMAMEFPLLNFTVAPLFALGPYWGRVGVLIFFCLATLGLTHVAARAWRGSIWANLPMDLVTYALPLLSFAAVWSQKFMPDYLAMILVWTAVGLAWNRRSACASFVFCALGLLMKPTSVVVLLPLMATRRLKILLWIVPAITVALLYYTLGLQAIRTSQIQDSQFLILPIQPWRYLREFLSSYPDLWRVFFRDTLFPAGLLILLVVHVGQKSRVGWIYLGVGIQILIVGGLAGAHTFTHPYYFMGATPLLALLYLHGCVNAPFRWLRILMLLAFTVHLLERMNIELNPLYGLPPRRPFVETQCEILRKRNVDFPWRKGAVFQSSPSPCPELGVCFGEREGSSVAHYGFFWTGTLPSHCTAVDKTEDLMLARCRPLVR